MKSVIIWTVRNRVADNMLRREENGSDDKDNSNIDNGEEKNKEEGAKGNKRASIFLAFSWAYKPYAF